MALCTHCQLIFYVLRQLGYRSAMYSAYVYTICMFTRILQSVSWPDKVDVQYRIAENFGGRKQW